MQKSNSTPLSSVSCPTTMMAGSQTNAGETTSNCDNRALSLVYRAEDIALMLDISLRAAYNLCNSTTEFKVIRIGTSLRVNKASFDAWIAKGA